MNTLVINLFGGPCAGKSTAAAYLFYKLKAAGINCEYVTEFAKDKTWEHNAMSLNCQFYISGKQAYRLARVNGQVDIIVTDSPLLLGAMYTKDDYIAKACIEEDKKYPFQLNVFLNRNHLYEQAGRNQTEDDAKQIDRLVMEMLKNNNKIPIIIDSNEAGYDTIFKEALKLIQPQICKNNKYDEYYPPYLDSPKPNY